MADPVQQMMEMGFDESRSRKALSVCNNNGVRNLEKTDRIVFNWDAVQNRGGTVDQSISTGKKYLHIGFACI